MVRIYTYCWLMCSCYLFIVSITKREYKHESWTMKLLVVYTITIIEIPIGYAHTHPSLLVDLLKGCSLNYKYTPIVIKVYMSSNHIFHNMFGKFCIFLLVVKDGWLSQHLHAVSLHVQYISVFDYWSTCTCTCTYRQNSVIPIMTWK